MNHTENKTFKQSLKNIVINTFKNAYKTIFFMLKIIIPVTFIVKLLQYLDFLKYITSLFEPLMQFFGLSGDAALVLITSNLINIYGGLAVMGTLSFTVKEVTILGVMILFSHSLLVESAVIKGLKVPIYRQLLIRIGAAVFSGIILNILIGNHYSEIANTIGKKLPEIPVLSFESFDLFFTWFKALMLDYITHILITAFQLIWIITSVLLGLEIIKELNFLDKLDSFFYYFTRHIGLSKRATTSLIVGLFIGISYGAGTILIYYKEGRMNKKDVTLVTTFLLLCHAIFEDVFLFINQGAVPWILIIYKISFTIFVVYVYSLFTRKRKTITTNNELDYTS